MTVNGHHVIDRWKVRSDCGILPTDGVDFSPDGARLVRSMSRICQLDAHVVNKIAAGEVIERPASVVKELLENSLDALATRIEVDVVQGGTELIRIVDDGEGIHPDDLELAVTSHATSKIHTADDLFRVQTLGFRGEALASVASVSQFRIRSRQREADSGYQLEVGLGRVGNVEPCGCPPGTQVEIRQLFANTPVRRKFLKTVGTEFGHVSEQFTRIALSHPRLHAVIKHNDKPVYELPATGQIIDRLSLFYGAELAEKLIWVESQTDSARLWGYVGHPSQSKANRKGQYLFLNGRWIQDRSLQHALGEAYRGLMMVGRQPIAYLFLEIDSNEVDVNVHPTKAEVRFQDGQQLYRLMLSALRSKFLSMDLDSALQVGAAKGAQESPELVSSERQQELRLDVANWAKTQLAQHRPVEYREAAVPDGGGYVELPHSQPSPLREDGHVAAEAWQPSPSAATADSGHPGSEESFPRADDEALVPLDDLPPTGSKREQPDRYAPQHRMMQIHDSYLVVETAEGMTVIDQHALHERVVYEQLRQRVLSGAVESQKLLVPQTIELSSGDAEILLEHQELLAQIGFSIESFGQGTVLLTGFPPMLGRTDLVLVIRDIADQLAGTGQKPTRRDILDKLLHMMSCKAAVKAGQRLTPEEMDSLLQQRHLIDDAHHCPHGRPTALNLSRDELDRQFGRLGAPGG